MIDVQARIHSFFIFNSNFGPKEGEELKRIIFYYPNDVSPEAKKMQVGLCEAVVKFMTTFSSEPCEALQTQSKRYIFYQPEKDYWMVLVARIPYCTKSVVPGGDNPADVIHPVVMCNLLRSAYNMFVMFHEPLSQHSGEELSQQCHDFFTPYIAARSLTNEFADIIQGISYLPLDKCTFFKVLCFLDLMETSYPTLTCVAFLYRDQLIWNGLSISDTLTLYQYLLGLGSGEEGRAVRRGTPAMPLVRYTRAGVSVCFTVQVNEETGDEMLESISSFMSPHISSIASAVGERGERGVERRAEGDHHYLYYNRLNLAIKSSQHWSRVEPRSGLKTEVLNIVAGIHADRESLGNYGELTIKTTDEFWITGKCSNDREFYVVIYQKNANLKEIADEVKRVCDAQMKGIFFHPT